MDQSFRTIFQNIRMPRAGVDELVDAFFIVLILVVVLLMVKVLRLYLARRRMFRYLLRIAEKHKLSPEEKEIFSAVAASKPGINPKLVFSSLRDFNSTFGTLIHELSARVKDSPEAHRQLHTLFALRKRLFGEVAYHFGGITNTMQLKTGQKITLEFEHEGQNVIVPSVVLDLDEDVISVVNPSLKNEFLHFTEGTRFTVSFYRKNDGYYQFESQALKSVVYGEQPFLFLAHAIRIDSIIPRKYFRASHLVPFKFRRYAWDDKVESRYRCISKKVEDEKLGVLINIGHGEIVFDTEENLTQNDLLLFTLKLNPGHVFEDLLGKVESVRQEETGKKVQRVGLKFFNLHPTEEELIFN